MDESEVSLLDQYASAAIAQGKSIQNADSVEGNAQFDLQLRLLKEIDSSTNLGRRALVSLLTHEDMWVRESAATHLLGVEEHVAIKVLEEVANSSGIVAFNAEMVLKEWRAGNLNIP